MTDRSATAALAALAAMAATVAGCAGAPAPREPVDPDAPLAAALGFVRDGVPQALVVDRLGPPTCSYESGRIVSYTVYDDDGRLSRDRGSACFALVVEYAPDGRIARHALVRQGSVRCVRE